MNYVRVVLLIVLLSFSKSGISQNNSQPAFKIIPLGVKGGSDESNLSSYMVAPFHSDNYICLDAGTLYFGIRQAINKKIFSGNAASILRNNVKGYLISHPHLDHVAGLIINSPDDSSKKIYGLQFCLDVIKSNYFTWKNWANFSNEGDKPTLNKYQYAVLDTGKETAIENTEMTVQSFLLSHSNPYQSTAFLIRNNENYLLYLGDTGADEIEKSNKLFLLWQAVALLIKAKKLKVIFIETSFPDEQPSKQLFGHLTPTLLMNEMSTLSKLTGVDAMKDFPIVITHIKPLANDAEEKIKTELIKENLLNLRLVFPKQAEKLEF